MLHRALIDTSYDHPRLFPVGLLAGVFLIYALYAHEYAAAFNADCLKRHQWTPIHVDDGTPTFSELGAFVLGMMPLVFVRRSVLGYLTIFLLLYVAWSLTTLVNPYSEAEQQFDCPTNGGNNEDLIGEYAGYGVGYVLMVGAFYFVAALDLFARALSAAYDSFKSLLVSASGRRD
jgi:hypothetical protein